MLSGETRTRSWRDPVVGAGLGRPTPPPAPRAPRPVGVPPGPAVTSEAGATVALALYTLACAWSLRRVFLGNSWLLPVFASAAVAQAAAWVTRRVRLPPVVAVPAALVVLGLMVVWTVFGGTTAAGVPTGATFAHIGTAFTDVRQNLSGAVAPLVPSPGFDLLAVAGTGLVALLADWCAFRWRVRLAALLPPFALYVIGCVSGQGRGRGPGLALVVAAAVVYLAVERASVAAPGRVWFAGVRSDAWVWTVTFAATTAAVALVAAVAISPSLRGQDGVGVLGWRTGIGPGGDGTRVVANPLVDLRTRLIEQSHTPVFTVASDVASYWRLTSLDNFNGVTWTSTGSYRGFGSRLPGVASVPAGTQKVQETFTVEQLESVWLPDAFDPVAVAGVRDVSYDPQTGSLLGAAHTSDGLHYTVTSYRYLASLDARDLETAPPVPASTVSQYLELPSTLDSSVFQLAQQITAGARTAYDKAIAIQDYLRSPLFTYSLDPPSDGSDDSALQTFLFDTRTGYCQQFAGAYAVMARAVGLPTRLAVGFDQGTATGGGTYQVTDADAHTWPEVYFGSRYGWLPFEPTPSFSAPDTGGYTGTGASSAPSRSTPATTVTTTPAGDNTSRPKHFSTTPAKGSPTTVARVATGHGRSAPSLFLMVLLAALGALGLWALGVAGSRSVRRQRRLVRAGPAGEAGAVLAHWDDVTEMLAWRGVAAGAHETHAEFARRAAAPLRRLGAESVVEDLDELAGLARRAAFAPTVADGSAAAAQGFRNAIWRQLSATASWPERLSWWFVPAGMLHGVRELRVRLSPAPPARPRLP